MAKFCTKCGNALEENAKFCTKCGTAVLQKEAPPTTDTSQKPTKQVETVVAQQLSDIKEKAKGEATAAVGNAVNNAVNEAVSSLSEQFASSEAGEVVLGTFGEASNIAGRIVEILNPIKTVVNSAKSVIDSIINIIKTKDLKKLIPPAALAFIWLVLGILSHFNIKIGLLDWLTFAKGGFGRSIIGWFGGLVGKTAVAALVVSLINGGYKSIISGAKSLIKSDNFKTQNLNLLLFGIGGVLIVYQFIAGDATFKDTMPAISVGLFSIMALGSENGHLYKIIQSLTASVSNKIRTKQSDKTTALLSGIAFGSALSTVLSLIPFGWLPIIFGILCIIAWVVLTFVFGK